MAEMDYTVGLAVELKDNITAEVEKLKEKVDALEKEVKKSEDAMEKAGKTGAKSFSSVTKSIVSGLGIYGLLTTAISGVTSAFKGGYDSMIQYEALTNRLGELVSITTGATDEQIDSLIKQAEALDSVGIASKDMIVQAQSQLATFEMSTEAIKAMTPAIADYVIAEKGATATADDFKSMTNGLAQALQGNYSSLTRTGFILDENTKAMIENGTEMERVNAIVEVLNSTYEGFNESVANNTLEGRIAKAQNAFGGLFETISTLGKSVIYDMVGDFSNLFSQLQSRIDENADNIREAISTSWSVIKTTVENVRDTISYLRDEIVGVIGDCLDFIVGENEDGTSVIRGDWTDAVYFIQMGVVGLSGIVKGVVTTIVEYFKACFNSYKIIFSHFGEVAKAVRDDIKAGALNMANNVVNSMVKMINGAIDKINRLSDAINDLVGLDMGRITKVAEVDFGGGTGGETSKKIAEIGSELSSVWGGAIDNVKESWVDGFNDVMDVYKKRIAPEIEEVNKKTFGNKSLKEMMFGGDDTSAGGGSGGSKSKSSSSKKDDAVKEFENQIKEQQKIMDYMVEKQKKAIDSLNDEYQGSFDELTKHMDEAKKNCEKLVDEIDGLKNKMAELQGEKNTSIAKEFVKAKTELQKLEEQYEGLGEVANSVSYADLEGKGGVGKFDVDLIKQYKQYQDEMTSAYEGMSQQEADALTKEIEYQEYYDSLNGVEKIKEDYRVKQEEIQAELDSKLNSLAMEQETVKQYSRERDQLQKEWMAKLNEEVKKYEEMEKKKEEFEAQYMDILAKDQLTQIKYYDDLIRKAEELAAARERAARAGDGGGGGHRAIGGTVKENTPYLVGENGPELFVPNQNGKIMNNFDLNDMQGQGETSISINMGGVVINNGADEEQFASNLIERITRELKLQKRGVYI